MRRRWRKLREQVVAITTTRPTDSTEINNCSTCIPLGLRKKLQQFQKYSDAMTNGRFDGSKRKIWKLVQGQLFDRLQNQRLQCLTVELSSHLVMEREQTAAHVTTLVKITTSTTSILVSDNRLRFDAGGRPEMETVN